MLGHAFSIEVFRSLLQEEQVKAGFDDLKKAAFVYLALALDKLRDYNSRQTRWIVQREVMANTFDSHNFSMKWSYAEMAPLIEGNGYDWAIGQVAKCAGELAGLIRPDAEVTRSGQQGLGFESAAAFEPPIVNLTCKSGDSLDHVPDASIDCVVMDPP